MGAINDALWELSGDVYVLRNPYRDQRLAALHRQLDLWVSGTSLCTGKLGPEYPVHPDLVECCPDFSCCGGELWAKPVRERFAAAFKAGDDDTVHSMLSMSLGNLMGKVLGDSAKVHVAGDSPGPLQ